jgi:hypothetical protein
MVEACIETMEGNDFDLPEEFFRPREAPPRRNANNRQLAPQEQQAFAAAGAPPRQLGPVLHPNNPLDELRNELPAELLNHPVISAFQASDANFLVSLIRRDGRFRASFTRRCPNFELQLSHMRR